MSMPDTELTPEEQLTLASYNAVAREWAASHSTTSFWKEELDVFKKYLPVGRVLEIGCREGRDAQILSTAGFDYVGTDISERLLEEARKRNPNLSFHQQSIYELEFPENYFDGFWASAVLLHIPRPRLPLALNTLHNVIRPNGIGFISIKQGQWEAILSEVQSGTKIARFFVYYSEDEFSRILSANGYSVLEVSTKPMSPKTTWLNFFVKAEEYHEFN